MSNNKQTSKNIELTHKLIEYIVKGKNIPKLPKNVSFVPFSNTDIELNKANEELLEELLKKEKPVARAEELTSNSDSWKITPVNF